MVCFCYKCNRIKETKIDMCVQIMSAYMLDPESSTVQISNSAIGRDPESISSSSHSQQYINFARRDHLNKNLYAFLVSYIVSARTIHLASWPISCTQTASGKVVGYFIS
jgi:hypothetical protein